MKRPAPEDSRARDYPEERKRLVVDRDRERERYESTRFPDTRLVPTIMSMRKLEREPKTDSKPLTCVLGHHSASKQIDR